MRVWVTLIGLITGTEETPAAGMTLWRLMIYAFFVFIGLVIVFLVLPKLFARLIRRDAKPRPLQTRDPKR